MATQVRCTFLRCDQPPVKRTKGTFDKVWWYGCEDHIDAMIEAQYYGNTSKVQVETL